MIEQQSEKSAGEDPSPWNRLLSKYSLIWIWSIIVGLNSSLFFSFFNTRSGNFAMLGILMTTLNAMAIVVSIMSWYHLYHILQRSILPTLFGTDLRRHSNEHSDRDTYTEENLRREFAEMTSFLFSRAFNYMIIAITLKFMVFLVEGVFSALNKY